MQRRRRDAAWRGKEARPHRVCSGERDGTNGDREKKQKGEKRKRERQCAKARNAVREMGEREREREREGGWVG